jgi:hypothetical protein
MVRAEGFIATLCDFACQVGLIPLSAFFGSPQSTHDESCNLARRFFYLRVFALFDVSSGFGASRTEIDVKKVFLIFPHSPFTLLSRLDFFFTRLM